MDSKIIGNNNRNEWRIWKRPLSNQSKNSINDEEVISNNKLHQNGRVVYKWAIQTLSYDL